MQEDIVIAGFPIAHDVVLMKRDEYEGIQYEIKNHERARYDFVGEGCGTLQESGGTWTYYIYITEASLPSEKFAEFWDLKPTVSVRSSGIPSVSYDYYAARFADVEWHGGVTFYAKLGGLDGAQRSVKIGCDYAHAWDEGRSFDFEEVESDAINTIQALQAMYEFYRRCPYMGTYQPTSEMVEHKGRLYSVAGKAKQESA